MEKAIQRVYSRKMLMTFARAHLETVLKQLYEGCHKNKSRYSSVSDRGPCIRKAAVHRRSLQISEEQKGSFMYSFDHTGKMAFKNRTGQNVLGSFADC